RRFPAAAPVRLEEDRRGILRFVFHSSLATGVVSLRGALAPLLLGIVSRPVQVGFFRIAQAPQQGLASLSAPARLIMLTEQTRDWARGATAVVFAGVRRYASWAALLMAVLVPPAYILMPWLVRVLYGEDYEGASDAARLVLLAAALQFVFGWSKSLPVSIGRPGLRVLAHGVESVVMIPLVVVLGREWGATGAAGAVLASTAVFCLIWVVLLAQIRGAAA
ncbi:MAG: lipopolysaccharide biosynthesis protein, partial [Solirubrobacteraceae bacterium]